MEPRVHIWALPSGSKAMMSILSLDVTVEDVEMKLLLEGVVSGIDAATIQKAVTQVHSSGKLESNIVVAQSDITEPFLLLGGKKHELTTAVLHDLRDRFTSISVLIDAIKNKGADMAVQEGLFLVNEETFCIESYAQQGTDIFGRSVKNSKLVGSSLTCNETILINRQEDRVEYSAAKTGYLGIDSDGKYGIVDPILISADKMEKHFLILPVWQNVESLLDHYDQEQSSRDSIESGVSAVLQREKIRSLVSGKKGTRVLLQKGKPPIPATAGRIKILVEAPAEPTVREDGSIDLRETSVLRQVEEGVELVEKTLPIAGVTGINVFGEKIAVDPPADVAFKCGNNVIERKENGRITYLATCSGVLKLTGSFVEVLDVLQIDGDVGPKTGNVRSVKDVVIAGTVTSGYTVECGGNLIIQGSIENGATVICKKNLSVQLGIFGERAEVVAHGDTQIGFIQEGRIHVDGDLTIRKYIYNAHVFCSGHLTVEGVGIDGSARGAILGGETIAMEHMVVASVGCEGQTTRICCGINPEALEMVTTIKGKITALNKRAASIRSAMRIDLDAPDVRERLLLLPDREKERIKALLINLKALSQEQTTYTGKLQPLEKMAISERLNLCSIAIKKHVIPLVLIRIGKDMRIEQAKRSGGIYRYVEEQGIEVKSL